MFLIALAQQVFWLPSMDPCTCHRRRTALSLGIAVDLASFTMSYIVECSPPSHSLTYLQQHHYCLETRLREVCSNYVCLSHQSTKNESRNHGGMWFHEKCQHSCKLQRLYLRRYYAQLSQSCSKKKCVSSYKLEMSSIALEHVPFFLIFSICCQSWVLCTMLCKST